MEKTAFFDNLQARINRMLDESPAADMRNNLRALLQQGFEHFDLATREQLDLQTELLSRAQGRIANLEARIVRLRHSLTAWDELKGPKTQAGIRDVPLPLHVVALFREWLATFYRENERGLLFTGRHSSRGASSSNFHEKQWHPLLKRAGLHDADPFHFHALRHFAASWWIGNGMPLTDVAKLMGHSKVDMTMQVYAHSLSNNSIRSDMVDRMSRALIEAPVVLDAETFVPSVAPDARFPPNSLF